LFLMICAESAADSEIVIRPTIAANNINKWEGEDEDDVKVR